MELCWRLWTIYTQGIVFNPDLRFTFSSIWSCINNKITFSFKSSQIWKTFVGGLQIHDIFLTHPQFLFMQKYGIYFILDIILSEEVEGLEMDTWLVIKHQRQFKISSIRQYITWSTVCTAAIYSQLQQGSISVAFWVRSGLVPPREKSFRQKCAGPFSDQWLEIEHKPKLTPVFYS